MVLAFVRQEQVHLDSLPEVQQIVDKKLLDVVDVHNAADPATVQRHLEGYT